MVSNMKPNTFKGQRFLLWNKDTRELIEVSASNQVEALARYGWGKDKTVVVCKGRKTYLINPIRLGQTASPLTRSIYDE